jgi:hypothetical protein
MTIRSFVPGTVALVLAGLLLTACVQPRRAAVPMPTGNGIESLGAAEIMERTRAAFASAGSYRFDGCRGAEGPLPCAEYQATGDDFTGRMTALDGVAEILSVDGRHYMRPDERMWDQLLGSVTAEQRAAMLEHAGDNWIETPAGGDAFGARFDRADLIADLERVQEVTKGAPTEIDGRSAFTMGTAGGDLVIATVGEPYPIRWGLENVSATFSDFDAVFPQILAPPADRVVTLASVIAAVDRAGS